MPDQISTQERAAAAVAVRRLNKKMEGSHYSVEYRPLRRVRGWPTASTKPFSLYDGAAFIASFATADKAEQNWRARAGC